jgi:hypothetical protein
MHSKVQTVLIFFFFLVIMALFIVSRFQEARQLIRLLSGSSEAYESCSTKKTTENMDCRNVAHPSQQYTSSHSLLSLRAVGRAINSCHSTVSLLPNLSSPDFLYSPKLNGPEKNISNGRGHNYEYD